MNQFRFALLVALLHSAVACSSEASIDFYFTNDAFLEQHDSTAALEKWKSQCLAGGEFADFAATYAPDPKMNSAERSVQAAKFDRAEAVRLATDAWKKANAALSQGPLRVCIDLVRPSDGFTKDQMGGISAVTAGRGRVILRIHPDGNWKASLPYTLAHEMHHSYWVQHHFDPNAPFTLADYLVFEGRADYFASTLFPYRVPWTAALSADAYEATWLPVSKQLNSTDWGILQSTMFGSPQAGIPQWAGYTIGYRLVSDRMTRVPLLDLKKMPAAPASMFMPVKK